LLANVAWQDADGYTALHEAAFQGLPFRRYYRYYFTTDAIGCLFGLLFFGCLPFDVCTLGYISINSSVKRAPSGDAQACELLMVFGGIPFFKGIHLDDINIPLFEDTPCSSPIQQIPLQIITGISSGKTDSELCESSR
jgi:hypothetical protein